MSISVQLEASNDQVVSYLNKLWNDDKPVVPNNNLVSNNDIGVVQTTSIIQQLIDAKILNVLVNENTEMYENTENLSEPKPEASAKPDDFIPVNDNVELLSPDENKMMESQDKININSIQTDYINVDSEIIETLDVKPITIQLENSNNDNNCSDDTNNIMQVEQVDQLEQVEQIVLDTGDKTKFRKQIKENLSKIREIGFRVYHDIGLEKEVNLITANVTNNDINKVFDFRVGTHFTRKSLMGDISRCVVFPKYKSGDVTKPENFRYLVNHHNSVKILDRIWCSELITKCGTNLPDNSIYKSTLVKSFNGSIITVANENTKSIDNVVMVDVMKAFDSLDWDILEDLLISNLTRKINKESATDLVSQYITILKNRELYYNNIRVEVSKGISTGLPSSNLVFTLAIEEILFRWFTKSGFSNNKDFKMNVYVDDIYMKIFNIAKASEIVNGLIDHLQSYKLKVNREKTKADEKLKISGLTNILTTSDYYLGIPFTRDIKLYGQLILNELNKKIKVTWIDIYDILSEEESSIDKACLCGSFNYKPRIYGFLNYKLRPLHVNTDEEFNKEFITKFVYDNFVKEQYDINIKQTIITIVVILSIVSIVLFSSSSNTNTKQSK
jgi:hypothetical protein